MELHEVKAARLSLFCLFVLTSTRFIDGVRRNICYEVAR
jgi:hypothetical protein